MPNGRSDVMAQYVYLAQLQAVKGKCKCNVCQLLRKGADAATAALLSGEQPSTVKMPGVGELVSLPEDEE